MPISPKVRQLVPLVLLVSSACATMHRVEHPAPALEADRPDFTESTETVLPGFIQAEGGFTMSREEGNASRSIGELLVRIPAGSRAEMRFAFNSYTIERTAGLVQRGFEDIAIGTKVRLIEREERSLVPNVSILALSTFPTGNRDIGTSVMQPTAKLALGWQLSERLSLGSNANYSYVSEDGTRYSQWGTSASLGAEITPRLEGFLEWFGETAPSPGERRADYLDAGAGLKLGGSLRVDARAGANTRGGSRDYFVGFGLSRRW